MRLIVENNICQQVSRECEGPEGGPQPDTDCIVASFIERYVTDNTTINVQLMKVYD